MHKKDGQSTALPVYLALILFSLALLVSMAYAIRSGWLLDNEHVPNVRAVDRIKLDTTLAHLWFEEALSGDRNQTYQQVWDLLDSASFYVQAMIRGGEDELGVIAPIEDPVLQRKMRDLEAVLVDFRGITEVREGSVQMSVPGTVIDQRYDEVFQQLIALAEQVESRLHDVIRSESSLVRKIQFVAMLGAAILSILLGLTLKRYTKKQSEAEDAIRLQAQAEKESQVMLEKLAHVMRLNTMNELAAGIAHEVNQPLTAIMMTAAAHRHLAARNAVDPEELRDAMQTIASQAERAGNVIRRLRSFVTREEVKFERLNVNDLIRAVVKLARLEPQMLDFVIQLDLQDPLPEVSADAVQIQQVILNLVRNAVEATAASDLGNRPIEVTSRCDDDGKIRVSVADQGVGLSESIEAALFHPFTTTKDSGMGVGLSISQSIIRAHGGRIWFDRNSGRPGTTFIFTLPPIEGGQA